MGGGLMQLVAYGAQDVYLTGEPQITFFKVVYRRHTNFAIESIKQTFNGSAGFGSEVSATIARNGDLVTGMHLEVTATVAGEAEDYFTDAFGHYIVDEATLSIGGQKIDKHYGMWLELWDELTGTSEKKAGYDAMVGKETGWAAAAAIGNVTNASGYDVSGSLVGSSGTKTFYIPLQFWFNRNPGLALPLIALQYHEVKLDIKFAVAALGGVRLDGSGNVKAKVNASDLKCELYVDYIYLDTEERRRFAQMSHEYLIDQLQYQKESVAASSTATSAKPRLTFNHPVKELVWAQVSDGVRDVGDNFNFGTGLTTPNTNPISHAVLQLNGHDRFSVRTADYFRYVQPYYHHTRIPTKPVFSYSFALRPEEHQPSGTCNFSRIDNAILNLTEAANVSTSTLHIFAVNYNVLRVVSGMGGLAYSN
tara:strand:+ start:95 stop:1357 length:1263 start_codon:yes stop_codon:yes gene_type:complete